MTKYYKFSICYDYSESENRQFKAKKLTLYLGIRGLGHWGLGIGKISLKKTNNQ